MHEIRNMVRRSTLGIFYITLFICEPVISSQNETILPLMLQETWHITPFNNLNVTRTDFDDHVALYYDNFIEDYTGGSKNYFNAYQWHFSELSTAWKYVKDIYGHIGPDPHLFLILHGNNSLDSRDQECSSLSFLNSKGGNRNLIDCHFSTHQFENGLVAKTVENFESIFSQIGDIIRNGAKGKYNDADRDICGSEMRSILFYDIYRQSRSNSPPADVDDWKEMMRKPNSWLRPCFFRWFIPIYEEYGGASVLNRYFELTKIYWQPGRDVWNKPMNYGEFLHFWSGAAGEDLQHMAKNVFYWTEDKQNASIKARAEFQFKFPYKYTVKKGIIEIKIPPWFKKAIVWSCTVIVVVVFMFSNYIVKNKSKLKKLENKYLALTAQDVDAFRVGSLYLNLEDVDSDLSILSMPFNMALEVPAERIAIDKARVLGQGEFGIVYLGILKGESARRDVKVAVKRSKLGTPVSHFKAFLSEIKIMAHLEKHENIAALLATVTLNISKCEVIAALELCEKGDLLDNLRKCRSSFRSLWNQNYSKWTKTDYIELNMNIQPSPSGLVLPTNTKPQNSQEITTLDLISWASQIAHGMVYLSSKNIIHGDLAARNVLLTADNIPKISDFGLSRQLLKYSNYYKTSSTPIPWKWLAIEALTHKKFSIQSDVWSFGVTLWEIFTLGQEPYPGRIWDQNFVDDLIDGEGLLGQPEFGNADIQDLMMNCMQEVTTERFSFARIKTELENIKASLET